MRVVKYNFHKKIKNLRFMRRFLLILVDLYVLFLFYNIAVYCMRGKKANVIIVICILILFMLTVYATDYRIGWFMLKNTSATLACLV